MNTQRNWSLDALYTSFESTRFIEDFEDMKKAVENMSTWAEENLTQGSASQEETFTEKIETYIRMKNDFARFYKLSEYAQLTLSVDTVNEEAAKWLDVLEELFAELTNSEVLFQNFIKAVHNLEEVAKESKTVREHSFFLHEEVEDAAYLLSREEELAIAKLKQTGSFSWEKLVEQLTGTLTAVLNVDGENMSLPLALIRNNAYDADPVLRRSSYEAELKAYEKIEKPVAFALNSIKGEVLTTSKMRGYVSPLDMTLRESRMYRELLDALLSAIRESLPIFQRYLLKKASILGHKNGLPFYDLFAPVGSAPRSFTYEEAVEFVIRNFSDFSSKLGAYAQKAIEEAWIDVHPREGKRGGAFCSNIHPLGQSRIMLNFSGSFNDVLTLAHELGHGYHGECLKDESYLNSNYPMPIAETASTLCETIVINGALKSANEEEAISILESNISGMTQVIVDIYSRFLFEDRVFTRRKEGSLSVKEYKELMLDAQKEAYGESLDPNFLHPCMWVCKPHYYSAEANYYNFPYAYGLLFAKGLYGLYEKDGADFVKRYDEMLKATGRNNLRDVAEICGVDVGDTAFWTHSLKVIEKEIILFDTAVDKHTNLW